MLQAAARVSSDHETPVTPLLHLRCEKAGIPDSFCFLQLYPTLTLQKTALRHIAGCPDNTDTLINTSETLSPAEAGTEAPQAGTGLRAPAEQTAASEGEYISIF